MPEHKIKPWHHTYQVKTLITLIDWSEEGYHDEDEESQQIQTEVQKYA